MIKPLSPQTLTLKFDRPLERLLRLALEEDIGPGDVTTDSVVSASEQPGEGKLIAKANGVFCGRGVADRIWRMVSPKVKLNWKVDDGDKVKPLRVLAELRGPYCALLKGERVALNFLQRMSGVATMTRQIVDAAREAAGKAAPAICDTRKTTPLWRTLERYAVVQGGGVNHRFGLFDMVLIKENHVRAAGGVGRAIELCRNRNPRLVIGAEATNEAEVLEAIAARAGLILLDNMTPRQVTLLMERYGNCGIPFEVSGGVNLKNIKAFARTGVDRISIGSLTHSAPALDLSLQLYSARR